MLAPCPSLRAGADANAAVAVYVRQGAGVVHHGLVKEMPETDGHQVQPFLLRGGRRCTAGFLP